MTLALGVLQGLEFSITSGIWLGKVRPRLDRTSSWKGWFFLGHLRITPTSKSQVTRWPKINFSRYPCSLYNPSWMASVLGIGCFSRPFTFVRVFAPAIKPTCISKEDTSPMRHCMVPLQYHVVIYTHPGLRMLSFDHSSYRSIYTASTGSSKSGVKQLCAFISLYKSWTNLKLKIFPYPPPSELRIISTPIILPPSCHVRL
jgi:hypothetical protein